MNINNKVLLTGAGFTANFGSPLAHEMWAGLFNNRQIQKYEEIRNVMYSTAVEEKIKEHNLILLREYDYEAAYHAIINGAYKDKIKDVIKLAMRSVYDEMDKKISHYCFQNGSAKKNCLNLIDNFNFADKENYFFTLNQDIFIERYFNRAGLFIPGFPEGNNNPTKSFGLKRGMLSDEYLFHAPNDDKIIKISDQSNKDTNCFYIKLHGSYNWIKESDARIMIIGYNKLEQAKNEPLIKYYFEVFEEVLGQKNIDLLIVGYGFKDSHINNILVKHIEKSKLKLFIINPMHIDEFMKNIKPSNDAIIAQTIKSALRGYYPYKLSDIINDNVLYNNFIDHYFKY